MRKLIAAVISVGLLLTFPGDTRAGSEARQFLEYGSDVGNCETEMAHLDNYAIELLSAPDVQAYVVVYGGRRDTARSELPARRPRIKWHLVEERGIGPARVMVRDGGFRENLTIELRLVPAGPAPPQATPTVSPGEVKYRRVRCGFDCSSFY